MSASLVVSWGRAAARGGAEAGRHVSDCPLVVDDPAQQEERKDVLRDDIHPAVCPRGDGDVKDCEAFGTECPEDRVAEPEDHGEQFQGVEYFRGAGDLGVLCPFSQQDVEDDDEERTADAVPHPPQQVGGRGQRGCESGNTHTNVGHDDGKQLRHVRASEQAERDKDHRR